MYKYIICSKDFTLNNLLWWGCCTSIQTDMKSVSASFLLDLKELGIFHSNVAFSPNWRDTDRAMLTVTENESKVIRASRLSYLLIMNFFRFSRVNMCFLISSLKENQLVQLKNLANEDCFRMSHTRMTKSHTSVSRLTFSSSPQRWVSLREASGCFLNSRYGNI